MSEADFGPGADRGKIETALADPAFASLRLSGAPVLALANDPARVIYASDAARALFGGDLDALGRRLLRGGEPGATRVVALSRSLLPGAAPRLERLRFFFGPVAETVTVLCRRVAVGSGETLFALAVLGMRAPQQPAPEPAPARATQLALAPAPEAKGAAVLETAAPGEVASEAATAAMEPAATAPSAPSAPTRAARFAWRTDADHVATFVAPALAAAVGAANADIVGRSLVDISRDPGVDASGSLAAALAARDTFSGVDVLWPAGDGLRAPVTLGAAPAYDADGGFDGFHGFGLVSSERVAAPASPPPAVEQIAHDAAPTETSAEGRGAPATSAAVAAAPIVGLALAAIGASTAEAKEAAAEAATQAEIPSPPAEEAAPLAVEQESKEAPEAPEAAAILDETGVAEAQETQVPFVPLDTDAADLPPLAVEKATAAALDQPAESPQTQAEAPPPEPPFVPLGSDAADLPPLAVEKDAPLDVHAGAPSPAAAPEQPGWQAEGAPAATEPKAAGAGDEAASAPPPADAGRADEIVALTDSGAPLYRSETAAAPEPPEPDAIDGEALLVDDLGLDDDEPATAPEAPPGFGKVVPLRPTAKKPAVEPPRRPGARDLSPGEKSAFEEIARALGGETPAEAERGDGLSPAANKRARDLIDLVARFGRSQEPPDSVAPAAESANAREAVAAVDVPHGHETPDAPADPIGRNATALLDRLPVGVVVSRFNVPIYANRTLLDLLDYPDIDAFHAAGGLERLFHGRAPESGGAQIETREGERLPVDARVQALDWDGQPATVVTVRRAHDNGETARAKALELDLRQRDAESRELHAILDTATDGVAVLDAEGRILSLNRAGEALFGYDQNEVAGEPFATLVAKESHEAVAAYFEGVKSGGVQSVLNDGREIVARARQGGPIPVFVTLGRLGSGATPKFCAVLRDLTTWKKAERELGDARREAERASALKSDFLAKISHEIRTPLNAILGFAEVIMDERFGPVGNARYRDYMRDIHKSGEHVLSLVNDLLDLSKIEAGKVDLSFASVDINAVVAECVSIMQPQANRDRVVMRLSLAPSLPNIVADERSMRQIVLNLLSNAVKFNEPGGQVIVSTALTDAGHAIVRIKDTGLGMDDHELETALEPFRQVSTARSREGTGLGLPLTKALVEANRAAFTIKSRKGEGTLVEVTFPPTRVLAE